MHKDTSWTAMIVMSDIMKTTNKIFWEFQEK